MAIHHATAQGHSRKSMQAHTHTYTHTHTQLMALLSAYTSMMAVLTGMYNTKSPQIGEETEATMAANAMQENRRSRGRRRCEWVRWPGLPSLE